MTQRNQMGNMIFVTLLLFTVFLLHVGHANILSSCCISPYRSPPNVLSSRLNIDHKSKPMRPPHIEKWYRACKRKAHGFCAEEAEKHKHGLSEMDLKRFKRQCVREKAREFVCREKKNILLLFFREVLYAGVDQS